MQSEKERYRERKRETEPLKMVNETKRLRKKQTDRGERLKEKDGGREVINIET